MNETWSYDSIHRRVLDYAYMNMDALYQDFGISEQGHTYIGIKGAYRAQQTLLPSLVIRLYQCYTLKKDT